MARCCTPEAVGVAPTVRVTALWSATLEAVERSSARDALIDQWARGQSREGLREKYGLRSVATELMTFGLHEGWFIPRLHDGLTVWRVPPEAFLGFRDGHDLEITWVTGRLFDLEVSERFRTVANLDLLLTVTEEDRSGYLKNVSQYITDKESLRPGRVASIAQKKECHSWLSELMRDSPTERLFSKLSLFEQSRIKFGPSLSRRSFDSAWDQAITETGARAWSKAGAPPKGRRGAIAEE